jgi:hypothetical protein
MGSHELSHRTPEKPTFYRGRLANLVTWLIVAGTTLYLLTSLARNIKEPEPSDFLIAFDAIAFIGFLVPTLRVPRNGVLTTSRAVTIRNILKTHVLQWEQIERFELPRQDPRKRVAVAALKDGASVAMSGIRYSGLESRSAQKIVEELNTQLAERRGAANTSAASASANVTTAP